jgi:hypothetical protein
MRTSFYGLGLLLTLCGLVPLPYPGYNIANTVVDVYRFLPQGFDLGLLPFALLPLGLVGLVLALLERPAQAGSARASVTALLLACSLYGLMAAILSLLFPIRMVAAPGVDRVAVAYAVSYSAWVVCALVYLGEYGWWVVRKEMRAQGEPAAAVPASTH